MVFDIVVVVVNVDEVVDVGDKVRVSQARSRYSLMARKEE